MPLSPRRPFPPRRRFLTPLEKAIARERLRLVLLREDGSIACFNGMGRKVLELSGPRSEDLFEKIFEHADAATRFRRDVQGQMGPLTEDDLRVLSLGRYR